MFSKNGTVLPKKLEMSVRFFSNKLKRLIRIAASFFENEQNQIFQERQKIELYLCAFLQRL